MRWVWHEACRGERSGGYRVLVRKPDGKRPVERFRHRWEENIKRDDKEVRCRAIALVGLTQDGQVVGCCQYI